MIWLSLAALLGGLGFGAWLAAKLSKHYYQARAEQRLAEQQAEFMRQMKAMQDIREQEEQNKAAVEAAQTPEEITNALDSIYDQFHFGK